MLSVGALGSVTTQTLRAFTEAEYRKIISGLVITIGVLIDS